MKLAILTNMVPPYRVPFFKELAMRDEVYKLTILTCVDKEVDREWDVRNDQNYEVKKLFGITLNLAREPDAKRILHFKFGILFYLIFNRPTMLVIGDASWTSYLAALLCRTLYIPYVVWNEITTSSKVSEGISAKLRGLMYRGAKRHIASCKLAENFLILNGVTKKTIGIVNNAVDNDFFLEKRKKWEPSRQIIRDKLGIDKDAFCFIYVGQLISRKRVVETVEWVAKQSSLQLVYLIVAGSGPLEQKMKQKAEELNFTDINFCGYTKPERLSQLYVASDGLVLFSEDEPWGMVVNEALLFGKYVFSNEKVGASNEYSFNPMVSFPLITDTISLPETKSELDKFVITPEKMAEEFIQCIMI